MIQKLPASLKRLFAEKVCSDAGLRLGRHAELEQSLTITFEPHQLTCTCDITGSTHQAPWDGTPEAAEALVNEAAEDTAYLINMTPHYAWLRSRT